MVKKKSPIFLPDCPLYIFNHQDEFDISSWSVPHQSMRMACGATHTDDIFSSFIPAILTPNTIQKAAQLVHQCIGPGKSVWIQSSTDLQLSSSENFNGTDHLSS